MREKNKTKTILILLIIILIIMVLLLLNLNSLFNYSEITKVKKVLSEKYDNIKCIDTYCSGIIVEVNNNNYIKVKLYDENGNIVANYKEKDTKNKKVPFSLGKGYFLATKVDSKDGIIYSINNKNGKIIYKTKNKLKKLSDYFVIMSADGKIGNTYTILDNKGNIKYKNINEYKVYSNEKYIYIESNDGYYLLDNKGKKLLENYKIVDEVKDDNDNLLYMVVKDENNINYYFNISNSKISLDGFNTYIINKDKTLTITRRDDDNITSYKINSNGKKENLIKDDTIYDTINKISNNIDDKKYYLYTLSILSNKQNVVLVDNKTDKTFGILDIESNNYQKLYEYNSDKYYSILSKLESTNSHNYVQISCDSSVCDNTKMIVFDLTEGKELFRLDGLSLIASNYIQYKNGYKIVKYSYESKNLDYKGKYVLYNNKNEELFASDNQISIIDSKYVIGKIDNESLILYSAKDGKLLNDDNNLADKLSILNKNYYKYSIDDETVIIDDNNKKIYSGKSNNLLEINNKNIYSIGNKIIKIYSIYNDEVKTYKLLKNETINDMLDNKINPYEGAVFINNNVDNYIKVINSNGKLIKKINNASIKTVTTNNKKAYIISQKKVKGNTKYGLYIAK